MIIKTISKAVRKYCPAAYRFTLSLKSRFSSREKKQLLENFISQTALQAAGYILPLITLPYLVRVLGAEKFGLISFAQAFIAYFATITDYGFNLSATREISINRADKGKISEILSSVLAVKSALLLLSFALLAALVFSFSRFRGDWPLYFLTFGLVLGQVLFPTWFFQGMERMKYTTFISLAARLLFTVLIFVFVRSAGDYRYVPILNSLGAIASGLFSLAVIRRDFGVRFVLPGAAQLKHQLKEGWHIFISTIAVSLYTTSNTFILGLFASNAIVGYYAGAEKLVRAVQGLVVPVSLVVYPYISKLAAESREKALDFVRKLIKIVGGVTFILSLMLFFFASQIVRITLGVQYQQSVYVLRVLAAVPFIVGLNNALGMQLMLNFGYKEAFSKILIYAAIFGIFFTFMLVPVYKHIGTSFVALSTEIFVTTAMFLYLRHKKVLSFTYLLGGAAPHDAAPL
ncbi:MAG: flippase [Elusimicrobiales bacterium]|nr:flippase [Elusimicrobiales bacterium]